ncbi:MAG TPA: hypothetical protein VG389_20265 [Myxococcota bacterium]|nr:hypothetical protein [Myxococcota bacterium]
MLTVLFLPLAAQGLGPEEGVAGRRAAARWAQRVRAAEIAAVAEVASLEVEGTRRYLVADRGPTVGELQAAARSHGAGLVAGGSVGVAEGGEAALEVAAVDAATGREVAAQRLAPAPPEAWLPAAQAFLTALFEHLRVPRGHRTPFVEREMGFQAWLAVAQAEDLAAARALGHAVDPASILAAHLTAAQRAPAAREPRHALVGVALELGLAVDATPALRAQARAALDAASALDARDARPLLAAGELALADGDAAAARALALHVLSGEPADRPARALAGRASARLGDTGAARPHFARYVLDAPAPERRAADLEVARWWLRAGCAVEALSAFGELQRLDPLDPRAALGVAEALLALERPADSAQAAKLALALADEGREEGRRAAALLALLGTYR